MQHDTRVCSSGGRELRDEELAGVLGSSSHVAQMFGPNPSNTGGPGANSSGSNQSATPPTFANVLLSSLPGLLAAGNSFWSPLIGSDPNNQNTTPVSVLGF